ncbi:MAG: hypothetical protein EA409_11365 [Saprospirales bacterium]|nr:MAG: hypothetical protein EA409_11365 [Saprospirales bacterium]
MAFFTHIQSKRFNREIGIRLHQILHLVNSPNTAYWTEQISKIAGLRRSVFKSGFTIACCIHSVWLSALNCYGYSCEKNAIKLRRSNHSVEGIFLLQPSPFELDKTENARSF